MPKIMTANLMQSGMPKLLRDSRLQWPVEQVSVPCSAGLWFAGGDGKAKIRIGNLQGVNLCAIEFELPTGG